MDVFDNSKLRGGVVKVIIAIHGEDESMLAQDAGDGAGAGSGFFDDHFVGVALESEVEDLFFGLDTGFHTVSRLTTSSRGTCRPGKRQGREFITQGDPVNEVGESEFNFLVCLFCVY